MIEAQILLDLKSQELNPPRMTIQIPLSARHHPFLYCPSVYKNLHQFSPPKYLLNVSLIISKVKIIPLEPLFNTHPMIIQHSIFS